MITITGVRTLSSWLWVHQPSAAILGSREKHVDLGDSVSTRDDNNHVMLMVVVVVVVVMVMLSLLSRERCVDLGHSVSNCISVQCALIKRYH